ncbi:hypothetical protein GCM10010341_60890 [Streptomyces noursei]|nr:hypothetical protein GCM10010341_60890 [Streptomyces noursei]
MGRLRAMALWGRQHVARRGMRSCGMDLPKCCVLRLRSDENAVKELLIRPVIPAAMRAKHHEEQARFR